MLHLRQSPPLGSRSFPLLAFHFALGPMSHCDGWKNMWKITFPWPHCDIFTNVGVRREPMDHLVE